MKVAYRWCMLLILGVTFTPTARSQTVSKCTNANLSGTFGFSVKGRNMGAGEYAIVGIFEADGQGRFKGQAFQSLSGDYGQVQISGTYSLASDCSGLAVLTFLDTKLTDKLNFVLVADGQELLIIDAGGGTVETGIAKKQFPGHSPKS